MRLAAIDIGSNAIRLQVSNVIVLADKTKFKKLEYIRFPLRLGHDAFSLKKISKENEEKFLKLMQAFKILLHLYEVKDYMACATSAMREASNGISIVNNVMRIHQLKIDIIDGNKEAEILNKALDIFTAEKDNYLHIDVGGGSTELNLYINRKKINAKSFKVGSVRTLGKQSIDSQLNRIKKWLYKFVKPHKNEIIAIGTGGNINKVFDLVQKKPGKFISLDKIEEVKAYIKTFSVEERVNILNLNEDRADVIIPAIDIYTFIMREVGFKKIFVPDLGLKDGIIRLLYERNAMLRPF